MRTEGSRTALRSATTRGPRPSRHHATTATGIWQDEAFIALPELAQWLYMCWASSAAPRNSAVSALAADLTRADVDMAAIALLDAGAIDWLDGAPVLLWSHLITPVSTRPPGRPHIPVALRRAVYERDGWACLTCGSTSALSLDHHVPYSLGGPDTFENLRTLCLPCNIAKGARI